MVILARLVANESDNFGYTTYVFQNLEDESLFNKYVMMTRFPNWETKQLQVGDEGYVYYEEIKAGVDKWYDGTTMIPYNYNFIQFIKFVSKPIKQDNKYIM